jgi:hypothetical protein
MDTELRIRLLEQRVRDLEGALTRPPAPEAPATCEASTQTDDDVADLRVKVEQQRCNHIMLVHEVKRQVALVKRSVLRMSEVHDKIMNALDD